MKTFTWLFSLLLISVAISAQSLTDRLQSATQKLLSDPQMKYAQLGLLMLDADTGDTLISFNPHVGLAPASCQKIVTGCTAFELLGPAFRFKTAFISKGSILNGVLQGNLLVVGSGDPTLGSFRYVSTRPANQILQWKEALQQAGIRSISGKVLSLNDGWPLGATPGGYTWNDIGNYYGAGSDYINWRENQYDLILRSGASIGDPVTIVEVKPAPAGVQFFSTATAAEKGTGDQANIYLAPLSTIALVQGTIPRGETAMVISGSLPNPPAQLAQELTTAFQQNGLPVLEQSIADSGNCAAQPLMNHYSPALDSLHYWFMKKSVNLYGEALVRAISRKTSGKGSMEEGLQIIRQFWKERGIEPGALRMIDGSGLSPQNRVTAVTLVSVLQYARKQWWFAQYLDAFPIYNQMTLKSGTIGGAKSFAGYFTTLSGKSVILAILVNNYEGSANAIVGKMFTLLDELKK
jgi:D-alanyl-D-alanine carboxypeptidase/D-alanyl-D-alanine-endopeptidase (penicillin-binding protein 4)